MSRNSLLELGAEGWSSECGTWWSRMGRQQQSFCAGGMPPLPRQSTQTLHPSLLSPSQPSPLSSYQHSSKTSFQVLWRETNPFLISSGSLLLSEHFSDVTEDLSRRNTFTLIMGDISILALQMRSLRPRDGQQLAQLLSQGQGREVPRVSPPQYSVLVWG